MAENNLSIGIGLIEEAYEDAILQLGDFEQMVVDALHASPALLADITMRHPDGDYHHPRHTCALDLSMQMLDLPEGTAPTGVWIGRAPDIGFGHAADYINVEDLV